MSALVHLNMKLKAVSDCFRKLATQKTHQNQWRTNEQWARLVMSYYQDILIPFFNDEVLDGKCLDAITLLELMLQALCVGFIAQGQLLMENQLKSELIVTFASNPLPLRCHHLMERNGLTLFPLLKPVKVID